MDKPNYVIKMTGDRALLYRSNGAYVRPITSGARFAVIQGEEIHVTMADGRVRIYNVNGSFKWSI
jgi:hypothetical protein